MSDIFTVGASNQNLVTEDIIVPFQIDSSSLPGSVVRVGPLLNEILGSHSYPDSVSFLLAELLMLTAMLGGCGDPKNVVTIQIQSGNGPISFMVADYVTDGSLRGFAKYNKEIIDQFDVQKHDVSDFFGKQAIMVVTLDSGNNNLHQAVIEVTGKGIKDCFAEYFKSSEDMSVTIMSSVTKDEATNTWSAGSIMLQDVKNIRVIDEEKESINAENWNRAATLLSTVTEKELVNTKLTIYDLLYRLFNEDGVRVLEPKKLHKGCRCNRQKICDMLKNMSQEDREYMKVDGKINVNCEFCNKVEIYEDTDLR